MRLTKFADVAEGHVRHAKTLLGREPELRRIEDQVLRALLDVLDSTKNGIVTIEDRVSLEERAVRQIGAAGVRIGSPQQRRRPLPVHAKTASVQDRRGQAML